MKPLSAPETIPAKGFDPQRRNALKTLLAGGAALGAAILVPGTVKAGQCEDLKQLKEDGVLVTEAELRAACGSGSDSGKGKGGGRGKGTGDTKETKVSGLSKEQMEALKMLLEDPAMAEKLKTLADEKTVMDQLKEVGLFTWEKLLPIGTLIWLIKERRARIKGEVGLSRDLERLYKTAGIKEEEDETKKS